MENHLIAVREIMPGCKVATVNQTEIMFGCPSEVLKVFAKLGQRVPGTIVLPFHFYMHGVVQASLEFPNYHSLFAEQRYFKGEKMVVIGTEDQVRRIKGLLALTLLGPTRDSMEEWGIDPQEIEATLRMSDHFALKKIGTQEIASIDDLIDFRSYDAEGLASISGVNISQDTNETFLMEMGNGDFKTVDINIDEIQGPPIAIEKPNVLAPRGVFGVTSLSKMSTGFDSDGYTSGVLLGINNMFVSVDGVPWMKEHLRTLGINPHEIVAHIITHIHDDHSNIFDLIVNGKIFHLISDVLGYRCLILKASYLLGISEEEVMKFVKLIEFKFDRPLKWYGAEFEFWRVAHPVPTFGFRVSMNGKSVIYSGDTCWGKNLTAMLEAGVISKEMHDQIQGVPYMKADVIFHDAGGGLIHPDINELGNLPPIVLQHIVPTHLPKVPENLQDVFRGIDIGDSWNLVPASSMLTSTYAQVINAPIFKNISEFWMNVVINQGTVKDYPCNYDILELGNPGKKFFILIGGSVDVVADNEVIAKLSTGDFFGEMSLMYGLPCNATVRSRSPVRVMELDKKIFMQLIEGTHKDSEFMKIHQMRHVFMQFSMFRSMPPDALNDLYQCAKEEKFLAGCTIIKKGDDGNKLYGITSGTVEVFDVLDNGVRIHIADISEKHIFGEIALMQNTKRNANVVAKTHVSLLSIERDDFERVMQQVPMLRFLIGKIAASRR